MKEIEKSNYRQKMVDEITRHIKDSQSFFLTSFERLPVSEMETLRRQLRKAQSEYVVFKNTLGKIAFKNCGYEQLNEKISGVCAVSFIKHDNPVDCVKSLMNFKKDHENFTVLGGIYANTYLDLHWLQTLAALPTRQVLLGKVVCGMASPISQFMGVSQEIIAKCVRVLDAYAHKKNQ